MIRLENIGKTYIKGNTKVEAIKNIDLHIEKGDIFGIIGLSGAGKSTLVRCINFLEVTTSGRVIFDGKDLGLLSHKELLKARQSMGMIFQNFNLLEQRTALKNVCYPLEIAGTKKADAEKRALELLKIVGLEEKINSYPSQLSGGQKQRVAIARALATNPKVLLCDEATSALDPNTTRSILELLKHINKTMGVTIVIITHEMKVVEQICNKVAVIDQSRIMEMGDVKEIFLHPKSKIARDLIMPGNAEVLEQKAGNRCLRLVFDGSSAFQPIISSMALECGAMVNIIEANTKTINGKILGQMLLQLPEDEKLCAKIFNYLDDKGVQYGEEELNV